MKKLLVLLLFAIPCYAQQAPSATGSLTAAAANCLTTNVCLQLFLPQNTTGVAVTLSGTWVATVNPEQSGDGGVTWVSAGANLTANGTTSYTVTALTKFRIRVSAFTSGTVVGTITYGTASSISGTPGTINGVVISGTPTTGQVPTATGSATGTWQTASGGGVGGACTNQFARSISATAVPTCATVVSTDVDGTIALIASPTFTGTPAAPTAAVNTNTTQVATTAFVLGQKMVFTSTGVGTTTPAGTQFTVINGAAAGANLLNAGESNVTVIMPRAGTVTALYVNLSVAEGAAATLAVTIRKASTDTTITCTVGNLGTACNDTAHTFTFVAGDLLDIKTIQSGTGSAQQISFGVAYF